MRPRFTVDGDPAAVRRAAARLRTTGSRFLATGAALSRVSTGGWDGPAADDFREAFRHEPGRWQEAGGGFVRAADALAMYADALSRAKVLATEAAARWDEGERVTALRDDAVEAYADAQATVRQAGDVAADAVRRACEGAPTRRSWLGTAADFVGGVVLGAGEAVWDLGKLVLWDLNPQAQLGWDVFRVATGRADRAEIQAEHQLQAEQVQALLAAAKDDPVGFGVGLGKAVLDWDTWADDPARAIGHLVPDLVATVASGGAGAGAKALRGLEGLSDVTGLGRVVHGYRLLGSETTALERAGIFDLAGVGALTDADAARIIMRGDEAAPGSMGRTTNNPALDYTFTRPGEAQSIFEESAANFASWDDGNPRLIEHVENEQRWLANAHHHSEQLGIGADGPSRSLMYNLSPRDMLRITDDAHLRNEAQLLRDWYVDDSLTRAPDGTRRDPSTLTDEERATLAETYRPRDEVTLTHLPENSGTRMYEGPVGDQIGQFVKDAPDGRIIQRVPERLHEEWVVWSGPSPWEEVGNADLWGAWVTGSLTGGGAALAAGAASQEMP